MKILFYSLLVFSGINAFADDDELDAMIKTQQLLRDSARVQSEALVTPEARKADRNASITALGKPELKQEIYNISADLLPWIVKISNGDPAKMQDLLLEASKNPKAFFDRIPAAERAKIKALSETIDSSRRKIKSP